jgi:hypothetical protein
MENTPGDLKGLAESSTKILQTENKAKKPAPSPAPASASTVPAAPAPQEEFPDPEEDDLDDLDGNLKLLMICMY